MKDIGKTQVARLVKPMGGFLHGRHIPKERLNHNTWAQLLKLEKPPQDGPYQLKSQVDPTLVAKHAKSVRNTMEISQLAHLLKLAIANKKITKKPIKKVAREAPTVSDWNEISPDLEAEYLGLEQLTHGQSIAIVGAGISGLSLAWILHKARPDLKIHLYEKQARVGGWMETTTNAGKSALWESGPRTLLPSHPGTAVLVHMLHQMQKLDQLTGVPKTSPTNTKGLVYEGKLVQLPSSMGGVLKFLSSALILGLKWPLLRETWRKARSPAVHDESVGSFVTRRFSPEFNDRIISALMRGIYAADSNVLSARSVARFKRMFYLERTEQQGILSGAITGSLGYLDSYARKAVPMLAQSLIVPERKANDKIDLGFNPGKYSLFGFREGIQSLPELLATDLQKSRNVKIHLESPVTGLKLKGEKVEFDTPQGTVEADFAAVNCAGVDTFADEQVASKISQVHSSSLAVVNVSTTQEICKDWFGVLVPKAEDGNNPEGVLGIIFDSSVRNASRPVLGGELPKAGPNLTVMLGGDLWTDMTKEQAVERALSATERLLGPLDRSLVKTRASLQTNSIPQYRVGHSALSQSVHERVAHIYGGRVALGGMAFGRGVGVSDQILDSLFLATRFSPQRQLLHPEFFFNEMWSVSRPDWYA